MATSVEKFRGHVDAAAGVYYRLDKGLLTGRNSTATDDTLNYHVHAAEALLKAALDDDPDGLFDHLDSHPRLVAKWNRVERRYAGLPA